jgi:hypothetical protein
MSMAMEM